MPNKCFGFLIVYMALLLTQCTSNRTLSERNLAEIYRSGDKMVRTDFIVHHDRDSLSTVHFRINTEDLLYARQPGSNEYTGNVKIHYEVFQSFESRVVIDSNTITVTDVSESLERELIYGKFEIPVRFKNRYLLKLTTTDVYRETESEQFILVDKSNPFVRQNFLVINPETALPLFRDWFYIGERLFLDYPHTSTNQLQVRYYNREFSIAPPPFAVYNHKQFDYATDDVFTLNRNAEGIFEFTGKGQGFYHFLSNTSQREGLTLFNYHEGFPKVNTPEEMISALRFITSRKEFTTLSDAENQKNALDQFWLKIANNPDRARELIKAYYNRVQNANLFYSCHKEGWKTDRGIIYIVFGPPDIVYRSSSAESWIYGEENNYLSVTFNFLKVDNPFSANDYTLKRAPIYKNQWYRAVDSWRQGRVTSLDF